MAERYIITIGRQYGSGGRYLGKLVSERLGIPFYDKELVELASKESGIVKDLFENADEKASKPFWNIFPSSGLGLGGHVTGSEMPMNDKLFLIQTDVVRSLAEKGSCVIVGRCADYALKNDPDLLRVFVNCDKDDKLHRITKYYDVPEADAETIMNKSDKTRSNYYNYYTGLKWGAAENYDLCLNTSCLGIEGSADLIADFAKLKLEHSSK